MPCHSAIVGEQYRVGCVLAETDAQFRFLASERALVVRAPQLAAEPAYELEDLPAKRRSAAHQVPHGGRATRHPGIAASDDSVELLGGTTMDVVFPTAGGRGRRRRRQPDRRR